MKKEEYVYKLKSGLLQFSDEIQKEVWESFESHFKEAKSKGKKDIDILNEFGSPEYVVSEVKRIINDEKPKKGDFDKMWLSKSQDYVKETVDYKMGASILIPLLLVLFYVLHNVGLI